MSLKYKIFETKRFSTDLALLARQRKGQMEKKLQEYVYPQLKAEPHFGANIKKLRDWDPPTWRYRVADWRFFYSIDEAEKIVFMLAASHRKEAYRK